MRFLVTGGTGLVGNNVVRALLDQGQKVRVLTRTTSDVRPLEGLAVEKQIGDVCDPESVAQSLQSIDVVIHAAAHVQIGWSGLATQQKINVGGTRHVARAARQSGVRMVHVSSVDALALGSQGPIVNEETPPGEPKVACPYVLTKRLAEEEVLAEVAQGLDAVIVNPGFMLGPWDWKPSSGRMLLEVARGRMLLAPSGSNDFCDVRDVVNGILSCVHKGRIGQRYILGAHCIGYFEAWTIFAEVTGSRKPLAKAGPAATWIGGAVGDLVYRITGREPDVNSASLAMACLWKNFDYHRAERELGYKTRPLRESATDCWKWFREYGYE